jgi:hypothetical protein
MGFTTVAQPSLKLQENGKIENHSPGQAVSEYAVWIDPNPDPDPPNGPKGNPKSAKNNTKNAVQKKHPWS